MESSKKPHWSVLASIRATFDNRGGRGGAAGAAGTGTTSTEVDHARVLAGRGACAEDAERAQEAAAPTRAAVAVIAVEATAAPAVVGHDRDGRGHRSWRPPPTTVPVASSATGGVSPVDRAAQRY